jgi:hypothetical protein
MLLVIYVPFAWLFFVAEPLDSALARIKMWPVLPGLGITNLIKMIPGISHFALDGRAAATLLALVWVGALLLCSIRLRRAFWPILGLASLASGVFSWVAYALMKA